MVNYYYSGVLPKLLCGYQKTHPQAKSMKWKYYRKINYEMTMKYRKMKILSNEMTIINFFSSEI